MGPTYKKSEKLPTSKEHFNTALDSTLDIIDIGMQM
jgi:hypothetical protein